MKAADSSFQSEQKMEKEKVENIKRIVEENEKMKKMQDNLISALRLRLKLEREESRKMIEKYKTFNLKTESSAALMKKKVIALTSANDTLVRNIKEKEEELTKCKQALIEEKEKKDQAELEKNNSVREKTDLLQELNDIVSCPVCLELPRGNKITICTNGHITCETCCR